MRPARFSPVISVASSRTPAVLSPDAPGVGPDDTHPIPAGQGHESVPIDAEVPAIVGDQQQAPDAFRAALLGDGCDVDARRDDHGQIDRSGKGVDGGGGREVAEALDVGIHMGADYPRRSPRDESRRTSRASRPVWSVPEPTIRRSPQG